MKLGFSTIGCPEWDWAEILGTAKDMGIDGIEIRGVEDELDPMKITIFDKEHLAKTRQQLAQAGIEIAMLASSVTLGSPKGSEEGERQLQQAKNQIDFAAENGIPFVRVLLTLDPKPVPADLEAAEELSARLEAIGNIRSDGRPILGMDSRDLLELTLDTCPDAEFIPAHIWTPHFALFGAFSGFDTMEECFGDMAGHIHAVETGLSSDPPMNWRLSALDGLTLVSHSDAHSPAKLGREADLLDTGLTYPELVHAIRTGEGFLGTVEFFPEEGKYHLDGHRNCGVCLTPADE